MADGRGGFNTLDGAWFVDAAKIGDRYYALVTARDDKIRQTIHEGIQIIDITDPKRPSPTASVTRATEGFGGVSRFNDIAVTEIGGHHYALMDALDFSVHIINVTEPRFPKYVSNATNGQDASCSTEPPESLQPRSGAVTTRWLHPSPAIACR